MPHATRPIEVLNRRRAYQGFASIDILDVRYVRVDGRVISIERCTVEIGDAVGILVHNVDSDTYIFVRQLRVPFIGRGDPWLTEIVAGKIDAGEAPEESARREVQEEIGYRVHHLEPLGAMYGSPGSVSEKLSLYYAAVRSADRIAVGGGVDDGEDLEIVEMSPTEALNALRRGELPDAKTQIALLRRACG